MTRPGIVRADTLDLQDEEHPTASSHQKPMLQGGLAPHQRAEVDHVIEERNSEEHALQDAWSFSGNLTEDPGAIDQAQQQHGEHATSNGDADESGDGGGSEGEGDDDMMDRISSSPSIDDGGYTPVSSPPLAAYRLQWPQRTSSLSPAPRHTPTPTRETFNQSATSTPSSSPFLHTPQHYPLHVRRTGVVASPLFRQDDWSPDSFGYSPRRSALMRIQPADTAFSYQSSYHHPMGRYFPEPAPTEEVIYENIGFEELLEDDEHAPQTENSVEGRNSDHISTTFAGDDDQASESSVLVHSVDPADDHIRSPFIHNTTYSAPMELEEWPSLTSMGSVNLQDVLLPVDDPLLDTPPSPTDSSGSWESLFSCESGGEHDDDADALFHDLEDRFIDSGWGGECLRETEDIDFEFVYALHTFVATVEGQANATKGDTMVLLDDSNSYWWLVRVVKDSSIGYLPAEHIETPTERLARLNKHRNIDLSATMLSDNSEKTRNPIKKAIRRRNAKTVTFAAPTYVEASDYDYDSEEDDTGVIEPFAAAAPAEDAQRNVEYPEEEHTTENSISQEEAPAPAPTPRASTPNKGSPNRGSFDREQAAMVAEDPQLSPKFLDKTEAAPLKSKRTRNTDSFLKDDNNETRKITLTPGLLREDSFSGKSVSSESTRNGSLENLVKQVSPPDVQQPSKDVKKEKEKKKGSMLSGLFKSKKKSKAKDDYIDQSDIEKPSTEYSRESPIPSPLLSGRNSPIVDESRIQEIQSRQLQLSRGKLSTAAPPDNPSPSREIPQAEAEAPSQEPQNAAVAELQGSEAAYEMPSPISTDMVPQAKPKEGVLSPLTNMLRRDNSNSIKPAMVTRSKQRMELDDFDSPQEEDGPSPSPFNGQDDREIPEEDDAGERLSESPVEITQETFMHGTESIHIPTPSPYDRRDVEEDQDDDDDDDENDDDEEPDSLTSSPSLIEHPAEPLEGDEAQDDNDPTPTAPRSPIPGAAGSTIPTTLTREASTESATTQSSTSFSPATSTSQQSWSDSSLRAWLEDGSEVKDMMVRIHDKSGVVPVGDDHPLMAGLFTEQKKGVQDLSTQLDGLLGSYLQRKGIAFA